MPVLLLNDRHQGEPLPELHLGSEVRKLRKKKNETKKKKQETRHKTQETRNKKQKQTIFNGFPGKIKPATVPGGDGW
jgi:hypothetical protein